MLSQKEKLQNGGTIRGKVGIFRTKGKAEGHKRPVIVRGYIKTGRGKG